MGRKRLREECGQRERQGGRGEGRRRRPPNRTRRISYGPPRINPAVNKVWGKERQNVEKEKEVMKEHRNLWDAHLV
ncbi:unnamed protein product [Colias eurytheme]|nr:unnamed protein product [Colias eurytheme]